MGIKIRKCEFCNKKLNKQIGIEIDLIYYRACESCIESIVKSNCGLFIINNYHK